MKQIIVVYSYFFRISLVWKGRQHVVHAQKYVDGKEIFSITQVIITNMVLK